MKRSSTWTGWIFSALLIAGSFWLWQSKQLVVDAVNYYQYQPTPVVESVVKDTMLTDEARFTFYATRPQIESSQSFNNHCERKEANSPILGCYSASRIYIFDVSDERLQGIELVTAAHELLHAAYERLSESEKDRLKPLLENAYKELADKELKERMAYYAKTEPGESVNELHSIVGTEYTSIGTELEEYYSQYFKDRKALAKLHSKVDSVFTALSSEADQLIQRIEALADSINADTQQYNTDIRSLNQEVDEFDQRARTSGGFSTQAEFDAARAQLLAKSAVLGAAKNRISSNITSYKSLLARLDAINAESASLNKSLDSTLSDVPKI